MIILHFHLQPQFIYDLFHINFTYSTKLKTDILLTVCNTLTLTRLINLANRFHVAVRLLSNRSQMTSKCGKNKKVAHEAIAECVLLFLSHFDVLYNKETTTD